jgi:hypothetical protein
MQLIRYSAENVQRVRAAAVGTGAGDHGCVSRDRRGRLLLKEDGGAHPFSVYPALLPTNCSRMAAGAAVYHVAGAASGCAALDAPRGYR